jgi:hypothetical protein
MTQPPMPVEVVRQPKGPGFFRRLFEAIPTAVVTSLLTAFVLALWAPNIATYVSLFRPTCADPRGLVEVPPDQIKVEAASLNEENFPPSAVLDGRVANIWVPPLLPPPERPEWMSQRADFGVVDRSQSSMRLQLSRSVDVQLVCVVNGLANSYSNYVNWGRVRSVRAWTDSAPSKKQLSVLKSMDESSFQTFQDVRVPRGRADEVVLQVWDLYEGQQIVSVDPDVCGTREEVGEGRQNDPVGCNLNATPLAGVAEIKVYQLQGNRLKALWPF